MESLPPPSGRPASGSGGPEPADTDAYVGLAVQAARQRAGEHGWQNVRVLATDAIITMEYMVGRLNFAVEDERVVRCWQG